MENGHERMEEGPMPDHSTDAEREERITMEIVVDAYGPEEQAMGWYSYLEEKLQFPIHVWKLSFRGTAAFDHGGVSFSSHGGFTGS